MYKTKTILLLAFFQGAYYGCQSPNENNEKRESILNQLYSNVSIGKISVLPNGTIIALSDKGVLRSTNKGEYWYYTINTNDYLFGITFNKDGDVYITADVGIYSSSNFGSSWRFTDSISKFMYDDLVFAEIFNSITVTSNKYVFAASGSTVFCSTDRGISWYKPDTSFHGVYVQNICQINDTLLVTSDIGIFRSTNYGTTWDTLNVRSTWFSVLYTDSLSNIYLSYMQPVTYRSSDGGSSWQKVYDGFFESFTIGKNNVLFAGDYRHLLKSFDNGLTWSIIANATDLGVAANSIALDVDGYLYVGASMTGIYKSKKSFY